MSDDANKPKKNPSELRSQQWFGRQDRDGFAYRSWVKGKGIPHDQFDGRPVIGICNTFSELTPCTSYTNYLGATLAPAHTYPLSLKEAAHAGRPPHLLHRPT